MNVRITVSGVRAVGFKFDGIEQRAIDARPLMEEWYDTAIDIIEETFEKEGARQGYPRWEAVSKQQREEKRRANRKPALPRALSPGRPGGPGDSRILRDTGQMFRALTTHRHKDVYVRIEKAAVIIRPKDSLARARVHAAGSVKQGIPQRPWFRLGVTEKNVFGKSLVKWIKTGKL